MSTTHTLPPTGDWSAALAEICNQVQPGDVIVVQNETRRALAASALIRLRKTGVSLLTEAHDPDPTPPTL